MTRPDPRGLLFHLLALLATASAGLGQSPGPQPSAPGIRMTRLLADVRIADGVATTTLRQVLHNDTGRVAEAIWILPLPEDAVADGFSMKVGGVVTQGEVLDAGRARGVYESIVRQRRDPGLLEYVGRGCLRARVFPIPARGEVEVEVGFRQILPALHGLRRWSLPLDAVGLPGKRPEQVILDLSIESRKPIRNVFSPTAGVHVVKQDEHSARASYEGGERRDELAVFYGLSEKEFGLDLLSYRARGAEEGSFLMMISPKESWAEQEITPREVSFVLDVSGSMQGRKMSQAREAVRFFLRSLRAGDTFNVIPFSTEPEPFFPAPAPADDEHLELALRRVERLEARGGTNIFEALKSGIVSDSTDSSRLPIVVLLTDGRPTVGRTEVKEILAGARSWNGGRARVFVFGVGADVNTLLLDKLAGENGGERDYVREKESIEEKTSALFTKLSSPVMTGLQVQIDGVEVSRVVPAQLPDLFKGGRVLVFGRYRGAGSRAIRLKGRVGEEPVEYVYEGTFADGPKREHDFVPALWAERRVGVLLDSMRLNGSHPELLDEIVRLGTEHNIVTPYTSHLIVEEGLGVTFTGPGDSVPPRGGGGGGGPSSPGPRGPTTGPSGPSSPGAAGPSTASRRRALDAEQVTDRLREAGVLPENATREELEALTSEIVREMRGSADSLGGLGAEDSGKQAVSDSAYLSRLMGKGRLTGSDDFFLGQGQKSKQVDLLALFTRKVGDKVFRLRRGIWTDRAYDEEKHAALKRPIEAFSDAYFALLVERPELLDYVAFSERLIVVSGEDVFEIVPAAAAAGDAEAEGDRPADEPGSVDERDG